MKNFKILLLVVLLCIFQSVIEPTILMTYAYLKQILINPTTVRFSDYFDTAFTYYIFLRIIITVPALIFSFLVLIAFLDKKRLHNLNIIMSFYLIITVVVTSIFLLIESSTVNPLIFVNIFLVSLAVVILLISQNKKLAPLLE